MEDLDVDEKATPEAIKAVTYFLGETFLIAPATILLPKNITNHEGGIRISWKIIWNGSEKEVRLVSDDKGFLRIYWQNHQGNYGEADTTPHELSRLLSLK